MSTPKAFAGVGSLVAARVPDADKARLEFILDHQGSIDVRARGQVKDLRRQIAVAHPGIKPSRTGALPSGCNVTPTLIMPDSSGTPARFGRTFLNLSVKLSTNVSPRAPYSEPS